MQPNLSNKIIIVLGILIVIWLFFGIIRLLIPLIIAAVIIGWIWDIFDSKGKNKYDDYEEY